MPFSGATPQPTAAKAEPAPTKPTGGGGFRIPSPKSGDAKPPAANKSDPQAARPVVPAPSPPPPVVAPAPSPAPPVAAPLPMAPPPAEVLPEPRIAARAPAPFELDEPTIERVKLDLDAPHALAPAPFVLEEAPVVATPMDDVSEPAPPIPVPLDIEPKPQAPAPAPQPLYEPEPEPAPVAVAPPAPAPTPAMVPPPAEAPPPPRPGVEASEDSSRWVAPPPAEGRPTTRRSTAWVLFAAVFIIVMVGVVLLLRSRGIMGAGPTTTGKPKLSAAPDGSAPAPSAAASDAAAPAASAEAPAASAAPDASASGAAAGSADAPPGDIPAPPKDPKTMSPQQGYLVVRSKQEGVDVLIQGAHAGAINAPLEVACGTKFIALGKPGPASSFQVVGEGQTVKIECQALTNVDFP